MQNRYLNLNCGSEFYYTLCHYTVGIESEKLRKCVLSSASSLVCQRDWS